MVNLLYTEFLKLKRSKMFLVSIFGAAAAPFMCFIGYYVYIQNHHPGSTVEFNKLFSQTNLYIILMLGILLYGVITSYVFNREYMENTLKNLLTIPVSRISFIMSKLLILLIWIMTLTIVAWLLTLIFGLIGPFEGLSAKVLTESFKQYIIGGGLLFLLSTPTVLVTLLFKNYVPTIVFTSVITMINLAIWDTQYSVLYPWSAGFRILENNFLQEYPPQYSYISIIATSIIGFTAIIIYFKKVDIH